MVIRLVNECSAERRKLVRHQSSRVTNHQSRLIEHVRPLRHLRTRLPQKPGNAAVPGPRAHLRPRLQRGADAGAAGLSRQPEARARARSSCAGGSSRSGRRTPAHRGEDDQCPRRHAWPRSRRSARRSGAATASCRCRGSTNGGRSAPGEMPYFVHLLNAELFAVAGLHEFWPGKRRRCAHRKLHHHHHRCERADAAAARSHAGDTPRGRLRSVVGPEGPDKAANSQALLAPYPAEEMRAYPVSPLVNSAKNEGPELIEAVEAPRSLCSDGPLVSFASGSMQLRPIRAMRPAPPLRRNV